MFTIIGDGPYCAISYDSPTFVDLQFYMEQLGHKLHRQDPDDFLSRAPDHDMQFINLVTRFPLRQEISQQFDRHLLSSWVSCYSC